MNETDGYSEFRRDPYSGEWVLIAASRQERPNLSEECPFCVGGLEAPEIYEVKAFTNRWPVMRPLGDLDFPLEWEGSELAGPDEVLDLERRPPTEAVEAFAATHSPDLESLPAVGDCEVVLYTPDHEGSLGTLTGDQLAKVWNLWLERSEALGSRRDVSYVLVFENRGEEVGVTMHHPHGQIYAFPFVPPNRRRELEMARVRRKAGAECATCELAAVEPSGPRAVTATEHVVAYVPYASAWPYALHIVPRSHSGTMAELSDEIASEIRDVLSRASRAGDLIFDRPLPTMMTFMQRPYDGSDPDGSSHFRIELVSPLRKRETLRYVAAAEVASGTYTNVVSPESAARRWRDAFSRL